LIELLIEYGNICCRSDRDVVVHCCGCLQREELVLLLIQLRRSQTKLEKMRIWVREKLARRRPDEKAYRIQCVVLN